MAIGIAFGVILAAAAPASAAPYWQSFTPNGSWHCKQISSSSAIADVQACVVINGRYAQPVLTIRNKTSAFINIEGDTVLDNGEEELSVGDCDPSQLGPNLARACFGPTVSGSCGHTIYGWSAAAIARLSGPWSTAVGSTDTMHFCS
jgi:hypothetical protein